MNDQQNEHARLLARAKDYLSESTALLRQGEAEDIREKYLAELQDVVRLDQRVVSFLEANAPNA
jgi:hypothetical protein